MLEANDVKSIPHEYILRRWTRHARYDIVQDSREKEVEVDPKLSRTRMFRHVVSKFIKVEASCEEGDLKIVDDIVDLMHKKIIECRSQDRENHSHDNPIFPSSNVILPKGFKKRTRLKGQSQKRHKSWVEKQSIAKKKAPPKRQPCSQASQVYNLTCKSFILILHVLLLVLILYNYFRIKN